MPGSAAAKCHRQWRRNATDSGDGSRGGGGSSDVHLQRTIAMMCVVYIAVNI